MPTVKDTRRANLLALLQKTNSQAEFAREMGVEPAYISQLVTGERGIGHRTARRIETLRKLPEGWMDQVHDRAQASAPLDAQLVSMFSRLSANSKLKVLEHVQGLFLAEQAAPAYGPTVFEADVRERGETARKKRTGSK